MQMLTTEERFVLFVIQRNEYFLSVNALTTLMELSTPFVEETVQKLEAMGLISIFDEDERIYYPVGLTEVPLFDDYEDWMREFYEMYPPSVDGDTPATTFGACGVVLLSAVLTGSRDAMFLSGLTSLPLDFVVLVFDLVERTQLWGSQRFYDLELTLEESHLDFAEVQSAQHSVIEQFWNVSWTPVIGAELTRSRAGRQFGGAIDTWIEDYE